MIRRARWLFLLAIALVAGGVSFVFLTQRRVLKEQAPQTSTPLPPNTSATAQEWEYTKTEGDRTIFRVKARNYRQIQEPSTFLLEDLTLEIHQKDQKNLDLVKTAKATFDTGQGTLVADGDVEITMGLPKEGQPAGRIVKINSSKMSFDSKTSRVTTEEKAVFTTDQGDGEAVGADYDPTTRELHLHSEVKLNWRGAGDSKGEQAKRIMHIEGGELVYKEVENQILLFPWARMTRGTMSLEGNDAVVFLNNGVIERVESKTARGADRMPERTLEYGADFLVMVFAPKGEVRKIEGMERARLVSMNAAGRTTVTSKRIDLTFESSAEDSVLQTALASGQSRVESKPAERQGLVTPPTRILAADVIEVNMRAGGREIEKLVTHAPGEIDFIPSRPTEKKRRLTGERIYITYGPDNQIQTFRSVNVTTVTETPAKEKGKAPTIAKTKSTDFQADFDPKTGQMARIEQWPNFEYEEGARRAKAERAVLDSSRDLITLKGKARMSDEGGSTAADEITLEQTTGDFAAVGNVSSTRMPEQKPAKPGASASMLSNSEALQAKAERMSAAEGNRKIRYEGNAVMWQGASRLQAQRILIDRDSGLLDARGSVVSQFPDQAQESDPKAAGGSGSKKTGAVKFTVVRAAEMTYSDQDKVAHYKKDVVLERPGLQMKSQQLRAWFREEPVPGGQPGATQSKLDRMYSDGTVDILDRQPDRVRRGLGEHAEYYLSEEKMILTGGNPSLNDSKRGITRGNVLTWFARQDRLLVDSTGSGPGVTRILKK